MENDLFSLDVSVIEGNSDCSIESVEMDELTGAYGIDENIPFTLFSYGSYPPATTTWERRAGASKRRIAQARQAQDNIASNRQGWMDSIELAAKSSDHTWDPQVGWVTYEEPKKYSSRYNRKL